MTPKHLETILTEQFRLQDEDEPLLNYTFNGDKSISFQALKDLPKEIQTVSVKTEFDLAKSWADFAKISIEDKEFGESKVPIWHGHYEQFGRVILEVVRMVINRDNYKDRGFYNTIPKLEDITFLGEPSGTEDRTFYRIWFNFLGHPEFQYTHVLAIEASNYAYWGLIMTWGFSKLRMDLYQEQKSS